MARNKYSVNTVNYSQIILNGQEICKEDIAKSYNEIYKIYT
jgi:hypothetical protein